MSKPGRARGYGRGRGFPGKLECSPSAPTSQSDSTIESHINQPIAGPELQSSSNAINQPSERNLAVLKRPGKSRGRARSIKQTNAVPQNGISLLQGDTQRESTDNTDSHHFSKTSHSSIVSSTSSKPYGTPTNQNAHSSMPINEKKSNDRYLHDDRSPKSGNKSNERYSHDDRSPKSGVPSTNNPKNRVLGRTKFTSPAMRSLNQAMGDAGKSHYKSNRPLGGERCFNFSYKEPNASPSISKPIQLAMQSLSDGKHILEQGYDGQVDYISEFYSKTKADKLLHMLMGTLNFEAPSKKRGGEVIKQPRLSVWFGPKDMPYSYSYVTLLAHEFSSNSIMSQIKADVENRFGVTFNSCLVNLYRDNKDGVGWHADDEKSLGHKPTIASLSLGETRRFEFCRKTDNERVPVYGFHLVHGSGLLMKGDVQERWLHCVPKEYHDRKPRLNLTFRTIYETK